MVLGEEFPLVSIVTPSYNALPYLIDNIESVKSQDYPAIEHIIIDGNSTDGTQQVLQGYPHLVWVSEPDRGQSHALNKGFRRAKGEIIGWLNADDKYTPGAISLAVSALLRNFQVDLVYSDLEVIDKDGAVLGKRISQSFDLNTLLYENHIKQPTVFMRRCVIDLLNGVDENLHFVMDRELWLRAGRIFKMQYLEGYTLASFRKFPGTKSFESTPSFLIEWQQVLEDIRNNSEFDFISEKIKLSAIRQNRAMYHFACLVQAADRRDRKGLLINFYHSIVENWMLLLNKGTWLIFTQGIIGIKRDRYRKYRR